MTENSEKQQRFRKDAMKVFWQAIESVNPENAINKNVKLTYQRLHVGEKAIDLDKTGKIYVIGAGKASAFMAKAIENLFFKRIAGGLICIKHDHGTPLHYMKVMEAGHPVPDENSLLAARRTLQLLKSCQPSDIVICLLSGGASAIWALPADPITLDEKKRANQLLLKCGANIHEVNAVRKHLSQIKGGRLAQTAYPIKLLTLAISDVVGDNLSSIGSGPTVGDPSTFKTALEVVNNYGLPAHLPQSILDYLWAGAKGEIRETPKPSDPIFKNNIELVISSNRQALQTAEQTGRYLGYKTKIMSDKLVGEARQIGSNLIEQARQLAVTRGLDDPPMMLIYGGETTVTVKGSGNGGRNQELVLAAALQMENLENVLIASVGTDGTDGPTDAAGAFADNKTLTKGAEAGINAQESLDNNDSYHYFDRVGDLIKTGPTGTNVMDIQLIIIG